MEMTHTSTENDLNNWQQFNTQTLTQWNIIIIEDKIITFLVRLLFEYYLRIHVFRSWKNHFSKSTILLIDEHKA